MNKVIILRRKKLKQFFSLLSFLPQVAQATHFVSGDYQLVSSPQVLSDTPGASLSLGWSEQPQERCLSPEHLRHWMLWSTEDTETLKCFLNLNALRVTHPTSQTETSFHRTFKLMDEEWMIWERPSAIKTLGSTENFTSTQHFCWQAARYGTYPSTLKLSGSSFWGKNTEAEREYSFLGAVPLKCKSVCHLPDRKQVLFQTLCAERAAKEQLSFSSQFRHFRSQIWIPEIVITWSTNKMEVDRAKMNHSWWESLKDSWYIFPCIMKCICLEIKNRDNPLCI